MEYRKTCYSFPVTNLTAAHNAISQYLGQNSAQPFGSYEFAPNGFACTMTQYVSKTVFGTEYFEYGFVGGMIYVCLYVGSADKPIPIDDNSPIGGAYKLKYLQKVRPLLDYLHSLGNPSEQPNQQVQPAYNQPMSQPAMNTSANNMQPNYSPNQSPAAGYMGWICGVVLLFAIGGLLFSIVPGRDYIAVPFLSLIASIVMLIKVKNTKKGLLIAALVIASVGVLLTLMKIITGHI